MYCIHRMKKYHTIATIKAHITRTPEQAATTTYANKVNPDYTSRNVYLSATSNDTDTTIRERYKARKNAVTGIEGIYTASPEWFKTASEQDIKNYFEDCLTFHRNHYGNRVICAVIHYDETTPHLHVLSIPEYNGKLCAREYCGGSQKLIKIQNEFAEIGKPYGLQRGKEESKAKHKETYVYNRLEITQAHEAYIQAVNKANEQINRANSEIDAEYEKINKLYDDIERMSLEKAYEIVNADRERKQTDYEEEPPARYNDDEEPEW